MKSPDLCPVMTQEWQRLSKLIRANVGLRYFETACSLLKGKPSQHGNDLYKKKDYHNKQQMNELLIIQSWEEILTLFKEASMFRK